MCMEISSSCWPYNVLEVNPCGTFSFRTNPTIRVILMSATIQTSLYRDYFAEFNDGAYGDTECLAVGMRRFPVEIKYAEDLLSFGNSSSGGRGSNGKEKAFASHCHHDQQLQH